MNALCFFVCGFCVCGPGVWFLCVAFMCRPLCVHFFVWPLCVACMRGLFVCGVGVAFACVAFACVAFAGVAFACAVSH